MPRRKPTPPPPPAPTLTPKAMEHLRDLNEARLEVQAHRAKIAARRLKESYDVGWDMLGPHRERLRTLANDGWLPIGPNASAHRHGSRFPFFQNETQLAVIRDLSRIVAGTSSHAKGLLRGLTSYTIGTGFKFKNSPKKPDAASKTAAANVTAYLDWWAAKVRWSERQQEAYRRTQRDGDGLIVMFDGDFLDLRFRWAEQLVQPPGTDMEEWSYGIETDPDDTETRLRYHFANLRNPAEAGEFFGVEDVAHFTDRETDSGIKRGTPLFSFDTKDQLDTGSRLVKNIGEGSAIRAAIAYMRQHAAASQEEVQEFISAGADFREQTPYNDQLRNVGKLDAGTVVDFNEGMEHAGAPVDPGTEGHIAVVNMLVECACSRMNAPPWLASSSIAEMGAYTSSLVSESPFVKGVVCDQEYYRVRFLEIVRRALKCAVESGKLSEDDLRLCTVDLVPPNPEVRDKDKEAGRAAIEIPLGVQSRQGYCSEQGRDFDGIAADNQQYQDTYGKDGEAATEGDGTTDGNGPGGGNTDGGGQDLRGTVGGLQAIRDMQTAFYAGQIPQEAAVAAMQLLFGFDKAKALALFPDVKPTDKTDPVTDPAKPASGSAGAGS